MSERLVSTDPVSEPKLQIANPDARLGDAAIESWARLLLQLVGEHKQTDQTNANESAGKARDDQEMHKD